MVYALSYRTTVHSPPPPPQVAGVPGSLALCPTLARFIKVRTLVTEILRNRRVSTKTVGRLPHETSVWGGDRSNGGSSEWAIFRLSSRFAVCYWRGAHLPPPARCGANTSLTRASALTPASHPILLVPREHTTRALRNLPQS